jgi:eukaryotic-like serine/threonine-protein kinase
VDQIETLLIHTMRRLYYPAVKARYPQPGTVLLGKYRVESLIGEGGMGAVVKAHHLDLDEDVAIKCLLPEMMSRDDIVKRFLREAKAAVKLKNEHIARVLDVGRLEDGIPYIVMEYLEGSDLNAIIKHHGAQNPAIAVDLALQACQALAEAHSLGIIHRDIKASNFFITQPDNQAALLKVLDFGIATAPEGTSDLTGSQSVIGTPAYMAPEQMRAAAKADARSDIWSLGTVVYEMLEGERPFRSEVYSELVLKVGMDPPHPMEQPAVPEALRDIVMKCLEKPMERRYQTVVELAFDLMPFASDPVQARASAERCARLLGRRNTRSIEAQPDGAFESLTPQPPILPPGIATPPTPSSTSQPRLPKTPLPGVLGRPAPMAGKEATPTSINSSNGELLSVSLRPKRRGLMLGAAAAVAIGLGIAGVYVATRGDSSAASGTTMSPASTRTNGEVPPPPPVVTPPPPPRVEVAAPVVEPPVKPAPPVVEPPPVEPKPRTVAAKKPPTKGTPRHVPKTAPTPPVDEPGGELFKKRQ